MTDYVVGDIQGCYAGLKQLLHTIDFNPSKDHLYAVGDLVARGEDSLGVIQLCYGLGDSFTSVLGNHDLHLLAIHHGLKKAKPSDNLDALLNHKHINKYIDWLRAWPLAHCYNNNTLITHAGLYPSWSIAQANMMSDEIHAQLIHKKYPKLLAKMYGNQPYSWHSNLAGMERNRFIINAFTRMRYVSTHGALDFASKMHPNDAPNTVTPWFEHFNPQLHPHQQVIFGHWASLLGVTHQAQFIALDTGYVWGNKMSCLNLTDHTIIAVNA